jgi:hypothetical protein
MDMMKIAKHNRIDEEDLYLLVHKSGDPAHIA